MAHSPASLSDSDTAGVGVRAAPGDTLRGVHVTPLVIKMITSWFFEYHHVIYIMPCEFNAECHETNYIEISIAK